MWDIVSRMPMKRKTLRPQEVVVTGIDHGRRRSGGLDEIYVRDIRYLLL